MLYLIFALLTLLGAGCSPRPEKPAHVGILQLPPPPADTRVPYGTDRNQFADLRLPKGAGPHPVVVLVHGGFWRSEYDLGYMGHLAAALTAAGFATWNIEYRRLGQPGGGYPGTLEDVSAAVDHLAKLGDSSILDLHTVIAAGHSAGGHLALWLASRKEPAVKVTGVVGLAAVSNLKQAFALHLGNGVVGEFLGGSPEQVPERYAAASPAENLPMGMPIRLIHGSVDALVPATMSEEFADFARQHGDDAHNFLQAGASHFDIVDPRTPDGKQAVELIRALRR